ncbi:hypothetical protein ACRAWG_09910 [Methylobacterium sp. P31]
MPMPEMKFFDALLPAAIHLHETMIEEGTTTPAPSTRSSSA